MASLSDAEWEVMNVLWSAGELTLAEIRERLDGAGKRWAGNTVQTFLARLEKKGAVAVSRSGLPYRYGAARPREHYERELLEDLKKRVFRGSGLRMVSSFMQLEPLSREDLAELRRVIDESFGEEDAP